MLLSIRNLTSSKIEATDGKIGHVHSFLFDDHKWTIRYLIVDTGHWIPGRKVLITPSALGKIEGHTDILHVELTKKQIKESPDIDTEQSVSRKHELEIHTYYDWEPYWVSSFSPGGVPADMSSVKQPKQEQTGEEKTKSESNLRNTKEVTGYKIHAVDGMIGHVDDFLINIQDWKIQYIVVDTSKILLAREVIIPPELIKDIRWIDSEVVVDATKEIIANSPGFEPAEPINREYETALYDYYGRPKYWT